jgi:prefoldin subunit 5
MIIASKERFNELEKQFNEHQQEIQKRQQICQQLDREGDQLKSRIQTLEEIKNFGAKAFEVIPPARLAELADDNGDKEETAEF